MAIDSQDSASLEDLPFATQITVDNRSKQLLESISHTNK